MDPLYIISRSDYSHVCDHSGIRISNTTRWALLIRFLVRFTENRRKFLPNVSMGRVIHLAGNSGLCNIWIEARLLSKPNLTKCLEPFKISEWKCSCRIYDCDLHGCGHQWILLPERLLGLSPWADPGAFKGYSFGQLRFGDSYDDNWGKSTQIGINSLESISKNVDSELKKSVSNLIT